MTCSDMLTPDDFPAFFEAVHGTSPFVWQRRLFDTVLQEGWPRTLAAPTASGKTAVLDIALFHLALQAGLTNRTAPLRIVFAVDRRVIVDQAFRRAQHIRDSLSGAENEIVRAVADALRWAGGAPLHVEQLR